MANPSLDGQPIFGAACQMTTSDNPRGQQENAFPGLNGLESLDLGLRGRFTTCEGRLYGNSNNLSDLAAAQEIFRSFNDGNTHVLVDTLGLTWLNVKLVSFEPQGKAVFSQQLGYSRRYTARFLHLT